MDEISLNRRNVLATVSAGLTGSLSDCSISSVPSRICPSKSEMISNTSQADPSGENIEEYGAEPNPDDSSTKQAWQNSVAIKAAANVAGEGGAIYIPAGVYHFGHDGGSSLPYLSFGDREPAGISIHGEGPEESTLAITEHTSVPSEIIEVGFEYKSDIDHGSVEIKDIRIDGNYENFDDLSAGGKVTQGVSFSGEGDAYLSYVHVRGWHMKGVSGNEMLRSVKNCTFEDNGIARHNETDGNSISHHISIQPQEGDEFVAKNCHFKNCSGSAINITGNDGHIKVLNCYIEGTGANLHKLSGGKLVELRNVYHEANTNSLESKLNSSEDRFYGRNLIQSLGERGDSSVTIRMEHVESRNMIDYCIQARDNFNQGPADIEWEGDMIAIYNAATGDDSEVIRTRDDTSMDVDIDRLSVHSSNAVIFDTETSDGSIETLSHNDNGGLGNPGDIEITTENDNGTPFQPDVPSKNDVGINSSTD